MSENRRSTVESYGRPSIECLAKLTSSLILTGRGCGWCKTVACATSLRKNKARQLEREADAALLLAFVVRI